MYGLMDIPVEGAFFTWNNKHEVGDMMFSRTDIAMVNGEWLITFPDPTIIFHPEGLFDHCPCTMTLCPMVEKRNGSFKYFNIWGQDYDFLPIVKSVWDGCVDGIRMFQVVKKLKALKQPLKEMYTTKFANIETTTKVALLHLHNSHMKLHGDPTNLSLQQDVKIATDAYKELGQARRSFLSQKAKVQWMDDGDDNTNYRQSLLKARRMQNRVLVIQDRHGVIHVIAQGIEGAFEEYYGYLLGISRPLCDVHVPTVSQGSLVTEEHTQILIKEVTDQEIKDALMSIPASKAPSPDGYTSKFFKDAFNIMGKDIILVVKEFFRTVM
ncbi:uncharacterized protein LOC141627782 [Silene latifolia]|uniref:uncharacterized protein LOC141627782 n=1 Tax=Silene latifolia TaxID=37657 RepID=UPI003D771BE6